MKKRICIALALILALTPVFSVADDGDAVRVAALKGPTGMAFAHMMNENDGSYRFILAGAPDEITGQLIAGDIDIAAVPTNLAAVLYNKTKGGVKALALITGGMLYVMERGDSIRDVADLEGKSILSAGQGAAPEYIFSYILSRNGVSAETEFSSEQAEVITRAAAGEVDIVVLPEPHVTTLLSKDPSFRVALSLTDLFEDAAGADGYPEAGLNMSTVIVRSAFLAEHPERVERFMKDCEASVLFALEQPAAAAEEIALQQIIPSAAIAQKALPSCALTFITGEAMRERMIPMLQVLFDAKPASVGGSLPGGDFIAITGME